METSTSFEPTARTSRKLVSVTGRVEGLSWSPDGSTIRFSNDHLLWEVSSGGSGLHQLLTGWKRFVPSVLRSLDLGWKVLSLFVRRLSSDRRTLLTRSPALGSRRASRDISPAIFPAHSIDFGPNPLGYAHSRRGMGRRSLPRGSPGGENLSALTLSPTSSSPISVAFPPSMCPSPKMAGRWRTSLSPTASCGEPTGMEADECS